MPDHRAQAGPGTPVAAGPFRLAVAWAGLVASSIAGAAYLSSWVSQWVDPSPLFAPFPGWQVDVVGIGLAVAVAAATAVSLTGVIRVRRLVGRTCRRRRVALFAVVPGVLVGGLVAGPMQSAVSWASDHTATAAALRGQLLAELGTARQHPPVPRGWVAPAPPLLAARVLHPQDLGTDWYDGLDPNPAQRSVSGALRERGETRAVGDVLTRQHRSAGSWVLDTLVVETAQVFATPGKANAFVTTVWAHREDRCRCPAVTSGPTSHVRVAGVTVWRQVNVTHNASRRSAAFVVGGVAYTLDVAAVAARGITAGAFTDIVRRSVLRAADAR